MPDQNSYAATRKKVKGKTHAPDKPHIQDKTLMPLKKPELKSWYQVQECRHQKQIDVRWCQMNPNEQVPNARYILFKIVAISTKR